MNRILPKSVISTVFIICSLLFAAKALAEGKPNRKKTTTNPAQNSLALKVYKSPTCGCCGKWVAHMEKAGFKAETIDLKDLSPIKNRFGIKLQYQSCHTGSLNGYVFEGHIPAPVIKRFLAEKPSNAIGLAVPAMPIGSPGMEMGDRFDPYDVLMLKKDGTTVVYQHMGLQDKLHK